MRTAEFSRKTRETKIDTSINIDGNGNIDINTGIGFFDHMLISFATHGGFDIELKAIGDLEVDCHHTVEDVGIVLGKAFALALEDKSGIRRFGSAYIPMDESLAFTSLDVSGRPYLIYDGKFKNERIGEFETCLTEEFLRAFAFNAGITLHAKVLYGDNDHHKCEALFKSLAYALKSAVEKTGKQDAISTKGSLD
ncbi:MAG: imidazoleglycerol-phosphate dehydratase HisB [Clostridiales bacterium]|nr:imidazoleglycerol-phosphate dehydratase HisB [Clostridiales bacterium]